MKAMNMKKKAGFTLIELVMVIVILGILAAFALPRFADLGGDARLATLDGARGTVKSAAAIAHSRWLADGSVDSQAVDLEGATGITMTANGYPTEDDPGIGVAAQISDDFDVTTGMISVLDGGTARTNCNFTYDGTDGSTDDGDVSDC
ncbi:MSHA pilin protein MshA [Marinobacter sp. LV10R510-11A]|uniref:type IV pilin protein n=1 Tax=Marinobacter sp. LV10R510-11A TaxID=1415568 RepID=UPI000BB6D4D6|nr:prepilin-type N-terminal cleavage/methylation domain-containing protein [Marinobacter sp. LV10R510-11A]SOB76715.1 MSHA pilin protein MshA [Marinobacter sp. LV10R510-11A]